MAMDTKLKSVGSGWKKVSKKGEDYLNFVFTLDGKDYKIMIFKNTKKAKENDPDFKAMQTGDATPAKVRPAYGESAPKTPATTIAKSENTSMW